MTDLTDRLFQDRALLRQLLVLDGVPSRVVGLTALASLGTLLGALLLAWPLWGLVLAVLLPWVPLFALDLVWTTRHYGRLALFFALVLTQGGHFLEHLVQMAQIHVQDKSGPQARGVFGALDVEWVHFAWNTWVLVAVLLLLQPFARNPWLWATAAMAGWHEVEHAYLMWTYLTTGTGGGPGLLAEGGRLAGGLPLTRADLHFLYNLVETVPLVVAFAYAARRTHNAWLARAFPDLAEPQLVAATNGVRPIRVGAGEAVPASPSGETVYVVTRGEAALVRRDAGGERRALVTLGPGEVVAAGGEHDRAEATGIWARTNVEVLALDARLVRAVGGGAPDGSVTSAA